MTLGAAWGAKSAKYAKPCPFSRTTLVQINFVSNKLHLKISIETVLSNAVYCGTRKTRFLCVLCKGKYDFVRYSIVKEPTSGIVVFEPLVTLATYVLDVLKPLP
jgi:hypothetical protein